MPIVLNGPEGTVVLTGPEGTVVLIGPEGTDCINVSPDEPIVGSSS